MVKWFHEVLELFVLLQGASTRAAFCKGDICFFEMMHQIGSKGIGDQEYICFFR